MVIDISGELDRKIAEFPDNLEFQKTLGILLPNGQPLSSFDDIVGVISIQPGDGSETFQLIIAVARLVAKISERSYSKEDREYLVLEELKKLTHRAVMLSIMINSGYSFLNLPREVLEVYQHEMKIGYISRISEIAETMIRSIGEEEVKMGQIDRLLKT